MSTASPVSGSPSGGDRRPRNGSRSPARSPPGAALQPGSTDVWTVRLGSSPNPLFTPARYQLQLTVIYTMTPPPAEEDDPGAEGGGQGDPGTRHFSNTTSVTIPLRAALRNVILGGVLGGAIGSLARSLQRAGTWTAVWGSHTGSTVGALGLATILSGAAVIFAARKADAQSFVTVEDFWGGVLVGFLIGYTGTTAFARFTGVESG